MNQRPPHPHENLNWPAWFYPPDTDPDDPSAKGRVFKSADDVPEGWLFHWLMHGQNLDKAPPEAPGPGLSRLDLFKELKARDIACSATLGTAALQKLLDEAIASEALEADV